MSKVSREVAVEEFKKWADFKRLKNSKLEALKDCQDEIIESICEGILILKDNFEFEQNLNFPIGKDSDVNTISKLIHKPRLNVGVINANMKGIKNTDIDGRLAGYICAVTGEPSGIIKALDTTDYSLALCIAQYFL